MLFFSSYRMRGVKLVCVFFLFQTVSFSVPCFSRTEWIMCPSVPDLRVVIQKAIGHPRKQQPRLLAIRIFLQVLQVVITVLGIVQLVHAFGKQVGLVEIVVTTRQFAFEAQNIHHVVLVLELFV